MSLATATVPSPLRTDETGVVRIGSSRVTLESIVHAFDTGVSAEEILATYPTLELRDVYATIAFILSHRGEVDAYMTASESEAERVDREWEARYPTADLRRRLRERAGTRACEAGRA
jgi:uncharacterized protein (DUF433 family)